MNTAIIWACGMCIGPLLQQCVGAIGMEKAQITHRNSKLHSRDACSKFEIPISMEGVSREEEKAKLASSRHGNLQTAAGDENLKDIFHQIRTSKTPTVINYGASWCRVCSQILPAFCQLSDKFPKLSFVYADIDECPETTQNIRYTPTFHFHRDGERVDEMYGAGEERLHDRVWLHS